MHCQRRYQQSDPDRAGGFIADDLVTAVVTSNELVAWVCIAASVLGVILLIVDAIRGRRQSRVPEEAVAAPVVAPGEGPRGARGARHRRRRRVLGRGTGRFELLDVRRRLPRRVAGTGSRHQRITPRSWSPTIPRSDTPDDDEAELPEPAEEAALHTVDENESPVDEGETPTSMPRATRPTNAEPGQCGTPAAPNLW